MKRLLTVLSFMVGGLLTAFAQTDMTSKLVNPSFENGFNGWMQTGMQTQDNTVFTLKDGNVYAEKWVARGSAVGDGSVTQVVKGLECGRYRLTAAAQNIQEDTPAATKTGAWLVGESQRTAVGVRAEYSVTFVVVTGDATIGFIAERAQGNWIAVDHFRLEYIDVAAEEQQAELNARIRQAETLLSERMSGEARTALTDAIATAKVAAETIAAGTSPAAAATVLRTAAEAAQTSIRAYAELQEAIAAATQAAAMGAGNEREAFEDAIATAQALYDNDAATPEQTAQQVQALATATLAYRLANATGAVPVVKTNPRYVRGAIEAFGRMSVSGISGTQILEQGFCWSTDPFPTVLDNRSTDYLECNGKIYRMSLQPATVYYVRPYVMTKNYAVGYGDVIKLSTLPMGRVTYTYYNNDGGDFHNNKNTNALSEACWYWSHYTSIQGFHVTANYSPGTPTADCGYGGGMRIGSNTGQRTGTMMHEMNHGIGGGTIPVWGGFNESPLRTSVNGDWAGEHANAVVRFWENSENIVLTAAYDGAHWGMRTLNGAYSHDNNWCDKYSFNGSHLEAGNWAGPSDWNGTQIVYIGNSLINQAMCEDGLVPVNYWGGGFCLPAYDLVQDDYQKYYIKSESADYGLYDSFLKEGNAYKLAWSAMSAEEAAANDSAAWYVSFDARTQYYTFRNAATGHVITYSYGFKTANHPTPTTADRFHVMRGRTDVKVGRNSLRGYWLIHPESSNTPATMTAAANGTVTSANLDLYDSATQQRWLCLPADELGAFDDGALANIKSELTAYLRQMRKLILVPHREDAEGADDRIEAAIATIQAEGNAATTTTAVRELITQAKAETVEFLSDVTPTDITKPFDLTFMVTNADISSTEGWTGDATYAESCCEFFQRTFNFYQTVTGLPQGNFKLMAQAFQRPGHYEEAYSAYTAGNNQVNAVLYAGAASEKVHHMADEAQSRRIHADDVTVGSPVVYVPNTMASAAAYFKKKLYDNAVWTATYRRGASLKIGIKGTVTRDGYWTIFDNFRLYFYGQLSEDDVTPVNDLPAQADTEAPAPQGVYDLSGRQIRSTNDLRGLPAGVYVVGGRKVVKR